jgi:hypothetical protein
VVAKTGRTTGQTDGKVAFRYAYVKLEKSPGVTNEYTIIAESYLEVFSSEGDSGAPVMDSDGKVVGMCLGGTTGRPKTLVGHESLGDLWVSYVTPMGLILQRIFELTGKQPRVVVPDLDELEREGTQFVKK